MGKSVVELKVKQRPHSRIITSQMLSRRSSCHPTSCKIKENLCPNYFWDVTKIHVISIYFAFRFWSAVIYLPASKYLLRFYFPSQSCRSICISFLCLSILTFPQTPSILYFQICSTRLGKFMVWVLKLLLIENGKVCMCTSQKIVSRWS